MSHEQDPSPSNKWLTWGGTVALILCAAGLSVHQISGYDIWWHIANGQKYFHDFPNIFHESFSYTFPGRYVDVNAFGGDLLLYGLYQFGEPGIVVGWSLLYALTVFFLYKACKEMGVSTGLSLILCLFALLALRIKHTYRPEIIAYLCFSAHIWIVLKAKRLQRTSLLWWSVGIYWVWGLCSSSAVFGMPMVGVLLLDYLLKYRKQWKTVVLVFVATCIAALCNFAGWMMFRWFLSKELNHAKQFISEYAKLDLNLLTGPLLPLVLFWVVMLVVFVASFRTKFWWSPLSLAVIWVSVGTYAAGIRAIPFFIPATIPWLAAGVRHWKLPSTAERWLPWCLPLIAYLLMFPLGIGTTEPYGFTRNKSVYPEQARQFIDRYQLDGPLYAPLGYGGYFTHFRKGKTKVAIDGRNMTAYPPKYLVEIYHNPHKPKVFEQWLKKYPTDMILFRFHHRAKAWYHLLRRPDFQMVHWDRKYILMVRRNSSLMKKIPKSERYQKLDLTGPAQQFRKASPEERTLILADVQRALRQDPKNMLAHFLKQMYRKLSGR